MSRRLADTHAHLADPSLLPEVERLIAAARETGVGRILAVGTELETSARCVELAGRIPEVYAAVGIHPGEAERYAEALSGEVLADLRRLAGCPKVVAIGEIGLDYFRSRSSPVAQGRVFAAQLTLAAELGLPVVIHNRAADADVIEAVRRVDRPSSLKGRAGVLHCFGGNVALAEEGVRSGFYVSFAGNVTFRPAEDLRAAAAAVPLERLLTETDSPYLAPVPLRGKTNAPANVALVAETLARVKDLPLADVDAATFENARRLFLWN